VGFLIIIFAFFENMNPGTVAPHRGPPDIRDIVQQGVLLIIEKK